MQHAAPPPEAQRLAALAEYEILDTPREKDFDDVAALASAICGTPIAVVNLIGEGRQFFKAEVGLGVRETPLDSSFCARAILEKELLVIPDATQDPSFACNPLVTGEPYLRFYAGALLRTAEGHALGTVCVLDFVPRSLSEVQIETLRVLARQVMKQLDLRRALRDQKANEVRQQGIEAALRASEQRLRLAQEAGRIGSFELDVTTGQIAVSAELCRCYGLPVAPIYPASVVEMLVVPEDARIRSDATSRMDGSAASDVEYRIRRADDGRLRWIARRAEFARDDAGQVVRMFGTIHDITDRRRSEHQQAALLELGDRLRRADTSSEVVAAASEILGRTLSASRAGYARMDLKADSFEIEQDWTAPGIGRLTGRHDAAAFRATLDRLRDGQPIVVANVAAAPWLARDGVSYEAMGTRAQIKVPLVDRGEFVGLLYAHQAEPRSWSRDEVDFANGVADRTYAALAKVAAEAEQRFLNQELSHRMKNMLATVQAIAGQTLKSAADRGAVDAFTKRLHALSAAHDVLLQQSWAAAPLASIARAVIDNLGQIERVDLSGPEVACGSRAALSLTLLLHELTTNALKHGALTGDRGRVRLAWSVEESGEDAELTLTWKESGGPAVGEPDRKGFGSRLIRMGLIGTGGAVLGYLPSGFEAEFKAPLAQVQQS